MKAARFAIAGLLVFAIGCAIGPNYKRPEIEVPENYRGAPPAAEPADSESTVDEEEAKQFADLPGEQCAAKILEAVITIPGLQRAADERLAQGARDSATPIPPAFPVSSL